MWLYVPPSCLSAPGAEDLTSACAWPGSGSPAPGPELWVTSSGKPSPRPLWWRGWRHRPWIMRLYGTISQPSTAARGAARWISSLPGSPASPSASPDSAKASRTNDGSGPTWLGSLARWDQRSRSWRTSQGSLLPGLDTFSGRWPRWGSMRNGAVSARPKSTHRTYGNDCSSWPTPRGSDGGHGGPNQRGSKGDLMLPSAAAQWPTPCARDYRSPGDADRGKTRLNYEACSHRRRTRRNGRRCPRRLNPLFVEWLMGWPSGWTSSACSAMEWSRWRQRMRSALCGLTP